MPPEQQRQQGRQRARRRQQILARRHRREALLARQRQEAAFLLAAARERESLGIPRRSLRRVAQAYGLQLCLYGDEGFFDPIPPGSNEEPLVSSDNHHVFW